MQKTHYLIIALFLAACSRSEATNDCITLYSEHTPSLSISAAQLYTIDSLFSKNNLDPSTYQFISLSTGTISTPAYSGLIYQVVANLFINDLPLSQTTIIFNFDNNGIFLPPTIGGYMGTPPDKDTTTHQTLGSLRQNFLNNYKKCTIEGGAANAQVSHPTAPYQDTCLSAQLEYVDASLQNTGIPYGTQLVKAWLVCPTDVRIFHIFWIPYPSVTVIDNTGLPIPTVLSLP